VSRYLRSGSRTYTFCPPAAGNGVDELLAVVLPHDPGDDRHRLVEGVLGLAGAGVVEDRLAGRPAVGLLALLLGPPPLHTSSVEHVFVQR
jgi:hypothetical protein